MNDGEYREEPPNDDDPALAFDRLRGEVSLLRHALEALTMAREAIDIPDYEPTLGRTEKVLGILVRQIDGVRKSPAMTLTPETLGTRLNASVAEATRELRAQVQASDMALRNAAQDLQKITASARRSEAQKRQLLIAGGVGLGAGLLLYAMLAGPVARMMPEGWAAAAPLSEGNRGAVQACREAAEKAQKPVRCTIEISPAKR